MENQFSLLGRRMYIISWLVLFALLIIFFKFANNNEGSYRINKGEVIITADDQGQYRVQGSINEYPVKYIIDTGATLVAIPEHLAKVIKIKGQYPITMQTAKGDVTGALTRVAKLTFANFHLSNVKVVIVDGSDNEEVLLGMNVLSQFNLQQKDNVLTIANSK